jgi:hypothetical protein
MERVKPSCGGSGRSSSVRSRFWLGIFKNRLAISKSQPTRRGAHQALRPANIPPERPLNQLQLQRSSAE